MITSLFHTWKGRWILLLCFCSFPLYSQHSASTNGKIIVTLTGIRSETGKIEVALYNHQKQWTDEPAKAFSYSKDLGRDGTFTLEIDSLPYTRYALAILDDENLSGDMEYSLGIPKEGWGMSMNPSFLRLKLPSFDDVSFDLDCPVLRLSIEVNYIRPGKKVDCVR